jgi:hypothetical protein
MKRLVGLLLVGTMALTFLAGCPKKEKKAEEQLPADQKAMGQDLMKTMPKGK